MKVFVYNNASGELELNEPEILLVREFEGLWEKGRNKCKESCEELNTLAYHF